MNEENIQEEILRLFGGKPEIKVSAFQQKAEDGAEWVIITCEDNGAGWDWDEMPEDVWERYHYIKRATEKSKGIFEYKAVKGQGAIVTLKFPASVK